MIDYTEEATEVADALRFLPYATGDPPQGGYDMSGSWHYETSDPWVLCESYPWILCESNP